MERLRFAVLKVRLPAGFEEFDLLASLNRSDGQTLAAGSCDKQIILCSIPLRRHVASLPLYVGSPSGFEQEVRLLRFSPDGNILAAALGDGSVRFFRAAPFSETDANRPAQVAPAL